MKKILIKLPVCCSNCSTYVIGERHRKCTKCYATVYCNISCKIEHWAQHEPFCSNIKRRQDELWPVTPQKYYILTDRLKKEYALAQALIDCGRKNNSAIALAEGARHHIQVMDEISKHHEKIRKTIELGEGDMIMALAYLYIEFGTFKAAYHLIRRMFLEFVPIEKCNDELLYEDPRELSFYSSASSVDIEELALLMVFKIRLYFRELVKRDQSWNAFLLGCHSRLGLESNVLRISRCYPALQMIYIYSRSVETVAKLKDQSLHLMKKLDRVNDWVIDAFLDTDSDHTYLDEYGMNPDLDIGDIDVARHIARVGRYALGKQGLEFLQENRTAQIL